MSDDSSTWPALPLAEWGPTRDTLHLLTQIVGKVRLARTPVVSHWWNVPLYVTARGLTTSLIPAENRAFEIDFDFIEHSLHLTVNDGARESIALRSRAVADFYADFTAASTRLGVATPIWPQPVEIPDAIRFDRDRVHGTYDPEHAQRFWRALVQIERVLEQFRADFVGKVSPVHLFWGALDIAVTRFSGRLAPPYRSRVPNCGPDVMLEAYSHEVSSAGYWPGPDGEGVFYSYAYPEQDGYRTWAVEPDSARFDETLGEYVLPYEAVSRAADPDATLLQFLRSTYVAAADSAAWDRDGLERRTRSGV